MIRLLRPCLKMYNKRGFHKDNCLLYFYEERKGGYPTVYDNLPETKNLSILEQLQNGCRLIKKESLLWLKEVRDTFRIHETIIAPNEDDIIWKFKENEKSRNQWVVTCDSDYDQGFSTAKLEVSPHGTGIFHGVLSTRLPKDGRIMKAGYCNITTVRKMKSFKRPDMYDWTGYNCLVLRIKGDGRCYMINILQRGPVDLTWYNTYHYVLYTRGGPYWQRVKIPFSKFVFAGKGTIQDNQQAMPDNIITNLGITLGDQKDGPYRLEVDYIGVCYDPCHFETFAYEMHDMSK